jgi:hypothetical protein
MAHALAAHEVPKEVAIIESGIAFVGGFVLGYAARAFVSHRRRLHAKQNRGLDPGPIW